MWPGPYGDGGSRKYLLSSLDQSLARLGLDYVDIFYSHRPDPSVPLEETMGALHTAVTSGRALYAGISNYSPADTRAAHRDPGVAGDAAADPPAVVLDVQPARGAGGRRAEREPPGRRRRPRHRHDRVLPARPGDAHRPLPLGLGPGRLACRGRALPQADAAVRDVPVPRACAQRDRPRSRPDPRAARPVLGAARRPDHVRPDRRARRRSSSRTTSPPCPRRR